MEVCFYPWGAESYLLFQSPARRRSIFPLGDDDDEPHQVQQEQERKLGTLDVSRKQRGL